MFTAARFRFVCLSIVLLFSGSVIKAQHDASGGSKEMMGGGPVGGSTSRTTTKSTTKPSVRPTTPARKPPVTTPARKPPVTKAPDANNYNTQGDQFYDAKNYNEALAAYEKAVELNSSLAHAHYRIGWIKNDREEYQEAIEPLTQASRLLPTYSVFYELGYAYRQLKRHDEAIRAYNESIRMKSDYAPAYHDIGWIHNDQNNYEDAVSSLKQAIRIDPKYADAHQELGYALRHLGRYSEAIEEYEESIRLQPNLAWAHLGLGDVYYLNTKQYNEAIRSYREGIRLRPNTPSAVYNLGLCYKALGNRIGAMEQYRVLTQIDSAMAQKLLGQINN